MNLIEVTAFRHMGGTLMGYDVIPMIVTTHVCIYSIDILRQIHNVYHEQSYEPNTFISRIYV